MPIPAAVDEPLVSPDDLGAFPGAPFDDAVVAAAAGTVRFVARWHIAPSVTQTITLDGPGTATLHLPTLHLTAVTAVTENGTAVGVGSYDWSASGMLTKRTGLWTDRPRGITITLTHGYDECPPELLPVIAEQCRRELTNVEYRSDDEPVPVNDPLAPLNGGIMRAFIIESVP